MTQQEFTNLTHITLPIQEFWEVHNEYLASNLSKESFCRKWVKTKAAIVTAELSRYIDAVRMSDHLFCTVTETKLAMEVGIPVSSSLFANSDIQTKSCIYCDASGRARSLSCPHISIVAHCLSLLVRHTTIDFSSVINAVRDISGRYYSDSGPITLERSHIIHSAILDVLKFMKENNIQFDTEVLTK